ncbi:hypothetical protein GX51_02751 [Blastomyces parvus]|uniref:Uncharacterized protein n=1 Tax=Blastomyces parvus TaxID=2060905 RepID=A0A2B7XA76_9EURO|nr:hypothetical protein GX51_02751 [Blastomyces parvus]
MCQYTSHEQYTTCTHTIPCHLKYDLVYCHTPNGMPLPIHAVTKLLTEPGFRPSRCCDMDKWRRTVLRLRGRCPACEEEAKLRAGPEVESTGRKEGYSDMPNMTRRFECGHSKKWVRAASLQKCFVYKGHSDDGDDDGGEEKQEGKEKERKKKRKTFDIGADVEIDMGDLRIAEFWETEYVFSEEEAGKIQFKLYTDAGFCGECFNGGFKKGEEKREKGKGKKQSRGLLGRCKGWMKNTFSG